MQNLTNEEIRRTFELVDDLIHPERPSLPRIPSRPYFFCSNCQDVIDPIIVDKVYSCCPTCGETQFDPLSIPDYISKNEYYIRYQSVYKRIAYFDACIEKIQGCRYFAISDETREAIINKMGEGRSIIDLRKALKALKLTKFYKCCYALLKLLFDGNNMRNQLTLTECVMLKDKFNQIQMPYDKYKVKSRRNFMSYPFVIRKLLHQIQRDDLLSMLSIPKNKFLIYQNELIWASIADELGWVNDKFFF